MELAQLFKKMREIESEYRTLQNKSFSCIKIQFTSVRSGTLYILEPFYDSKNDTTEYEQSTVTVWLNYKTLEARLDEELAKVKQLVTEKQSACSNLDSVTADN